jgi:hypothetical protein
MLKKILSLMIVLLPCAMAGAQVVPAARGGALGNGLRVGGEFSAFNPDFSSQELYGVGAYVDYDVKKWIGVEGNVRFMQFNKFSGKLTQNTYAGGARFIYNKNKFAPFGKVMYGLATTTFPPFSFNPNYTSDSYPYYSIGAGLDYKVNRRISIRGEYEYQFWSNFQGRSKPLEPNGFTFGASYRIF